MCIRDSPPAVTQSFAALVPSAVVLGVFFLVNSLLALTPYDNAFNFIFKFLQQPLLVLGNTLGAVLVAVSYTHLDVYKRQVLTLVIIKLIGDNKLIRKLNFRLIGYNLILTLYLIFN